MFEGALQPMHLLVILVAALFLFGPQKLAGLGKGLGEGIRNFKDTMKDPDKPADAAQPSQSQVGPGK
jgi:sec-independent protein translocase protein TatA